MRTNEDYGKWISNEIVKLYLYEAGFIRIIDENKDNLDYLIINKDSPEKVIGLVVIPIVSDEFNILTEPDNIPVIVFYINYKAKIGSFEIINGNLKGELLELNTKTLKSEIRKLTEVNWEK